MNRIFTEQERNGIISMSIYWNEVRRREQPIQIQRTELMQVCSMVEPDKILQALARVAIQEIE